MTGHLFLLRPHKKSLTNENAKQNETNISRTSFNFEPNQPEIDFPIDKGNRKFMSVVGLKNLQVQKLVSLLQLSDFVLEKMLSQFSSNPSFR